MSGKQAGVALGVTKATISRIETGRQHPSAALMRRIYEWTGGAVSANDLVGTLPAKEGRSDGQEEKGSDAGWA